MAQSSETVVNNLAVTTTRSIAQNSQTTNNSAFPSTQAITETTLTTTKRSTSTESTLKAVSLVAVELKINSAVTIESLQFVQELNNPTSVLFQNYANEFTQKLNEKYEKISNFIKVEVNGFSKGSVKCNFSLILNGGAVNKTDTISDQLKQDTIPLRLSINGTQVEGPVNTEQFTAALSAVKTNPTCEFLNDNPCVKGYTCSIIQSQVVCQYPCTSGQHQCENGGTCLFDRLTTEEACSCKETETHVFSGKLCEVKVEKIQRASLEKLQLESKYIVIIAASVGGVIVIAAEVVIVCLVYRLRRKEVKDGDEREEDIALDNPRRSIETRSENSYEKFRRRLASNGSTPNGSIGDLERSKPEVTRVVDGLEHKVTRDEKGNEVYIYQPKQPRDPGQQRQPSVYSSAPEDNATQTGSSAYHIDTGIRYQIKRPNVSIQTIRI